MFTTLVSLGNTEIDAQEEEAEHSGKVKGKKGKKTPMEFATNLDGAPTISLKQLPVTLDGKKDLIRAFVTEHYRKF